jgi:hypothetical protein
MVHDGRLLVQSAMPNGGHLDGVSTPSQLVQTLRVPCVVQPPVRKQLENPGVKLAIVHLSPRLPTIIILPLGRFTVTPQFALPCVSVPPGHLEILSGPPPELFMVNVKSVGVQAGGKIRSLIGVTQLSSTTAPSVSEVLVFEQSVADASLPIAALNLISALERHEVGSVPFAACFDRQIRFFLAFLPIALIFFASHLLLVGELSLAPTALITLVSQLSIRS